MDPALQPTEKALAPGVEGMGVTDGEQDYIDPQTEARIVRKLDRYIIPMLGLLYLVAFLDRSNIGNAYIAGMADDINLVDNQYGIAVSVLYATYCTFEPIAAVLFKRITPAIAFSALCLSWAAITIGTAFVQDYGGIVASRVCLGMAEAGLFPCINMYITMNFRPSEQGKRFAWIYCCAALSGAFGGLLAYGLVQMDGIGGWEGWRWLYAIEGAITFCLCPIAYFWLPSDIRTAWFFDEEEKRLCAIRLEMNKHYNEHEDFTWAEIIRGCKDYKTWLHSLIQLGHNLTLYGFTTFMPAIITGLGYESVDAQLMTVPVYFWASVSFFICGIVSDRLRKRGMFVIIANSFMAAGFFILIFAGPLGVRLFGLFVLATGVYPSTACNLIWNNSNSAGYYKRAVSSGLLQTVGNAAGAIVGQIYVAGDSPRYIKGMAISLGGNGVAIAGSVAMILVVHLLNRRRERQREQVVYQDGEVVKVFDNDPRFVLTS